MKKQQIVFFLVLLFVLPILVFIFYKFIFNERKSYSATRQKFFIGQSIFKNGDDLKKCYYEKSVYTFTCFEGYSKEYALSVGTNTANLNSFVDKNKDFFPFDRAIYIGLGIGLAENLNLSDLVKFKSKGLTTGIYQIIDGWAFEKVRILKSAKEVYKQCLNLKDINFSKVCRHGVGRRTYITNTFGKRKINIIDDPYIRQGYGFAAGFVNEETSSSDKDILVGMKSAELALKTLGNDEASLASCLNKLPGHVVFCMEKNEL